MQYLTLKIHNESSLLIALLWYHCDSVPGKVPRLMQDTRSIRCFAWEAWSTKYINNMPVKVQRSREANYNGPSACTPNYFLTSQRDPYIHRK